MKFRVEIAEIGLMTLPTMIINEFVVRLDVILNTFPEMSKVGATPPMVAVADPILI